MMLQKNYYQVLQVAPQATAAEIKAAYRKLAFKYHPDRNKGNTFTEAVFKEINEAYHVLSNPQRRTQYNAAASFSNPQAAQKKQPRTVSSSALLQEAFRVKTIVEKSGFLTIDKDALVFKIQALLSDHHVNILLLENNKSLINQYLKQVLFCMRPLTLKNIQPFYSKVTNLVAGDIPSVRRINDFYQYKKRDDLWQRYKIIIVLLIAIFLCAAMYIMYS